MTRCGHCKTRPARINTNIDDGQKNATESLRCWVCFGVEQQMAGNQDWRDVFTQENLARFELIQRENETKTNLVNRCKAFLAKQGFIFGS